MQGESNGTIHRTLLLLRATNKRRGEWFSITVISGMTGLPKSVVHRYLTVFVEEGYLQHDVDTKKYALVGSVPQKV